MAKRCIENYIDGRMNILRNEKINWKPFGLLLKKALKKEVRQYDFT